MVVWVSKEQVAEAKRTSPARFLRSRNLDVQLGRGGRSIQVPGVLRADLRSDKWVACWWSGQPIGDGIDIVRAMTGCSFVAAAQLLTDTGPVTGAEAYSSNPCRGLETPRLPIGSDPARGRAYLASRGIPEPFVRTAEEAGSLSYLQDGVVFLGFDVDGRLRAATKRSITTSGSSESVISKRDLRNSDKAFPCILPGKPSSVLVVEGGINGLAAQALAACLGCPLPTVIVTGGVNVRAWVSNRQSRARKVVCQAEKLHVMGENERNPDGLPDPAKQARTDIARHALLDLLIRERPDLRPGLMYPPGAFKDVADWLSG